MTRDAAAVGANERNASRRRSHKASSPRAQPVRPPAESARAQDGEGQTEVGPSTASPFERPAGHSRHHATVRLGEVDAAAVQRGARRPHRRQAFIGADLSALDDDRLTIRVPAGHTLDILLDVSNPPKQSRVMFSFDVRRSA